MKEWRTDMKIMYRITEYVRERLDSVKVRELITVFDALEVGELLDIERSQIRWSVLRAWSIRASFLAVGLLLLLNYAKNNGMFATFCFFISIFCIAFLWLFLRTMPLALTLKHFCALLAISRRQDARAIPPLIRGLNSSIMGLPFGFGYNLFADGLISRISELGDSAVVTLDTYGVETICNTIRRAWWGFGGIPQCFRLVQGLLLLPDVTKYPKIRRLLEKLVAEYPRQEWEVQLQRLFQCALDGEATGLETNPYDEVIHEYLSNEGRAKSTEGRLNLFLRKVPIPIVSVVLGPLTIFLTVLAFVSPNPLRFALDIYIFLSYLSIGCLSVYLYITGSRTRLQRFLVVTVIAFLFISIASGLVPIGEFTTGLRYVPFKSIPWHLAIVAVSGVLFLLCLRVMSFSWRVHTDGSASSWKKWRYLAWP